MLGAVMFGHEHFQPVIDAIVKLAEVAAKEPWELKTDRQCRDGRQSQRARRCRSCATPTPSPPSRSAATASRK